LIKSELPSSPITTGRGVAWRDVVDRHGRLGAFYGRESSPVG